MIKFVVVTILLMNAYDGCGREGGWSTNPDKSTDNFTRTYTKAYVFGSTFDAITGQPLDSVDVCLEQNRIRNCIHTGSENTFNIECHPNTSAFNLIASRYGYIRDTVTIYVKSKSVERNIKLVPR